MYDATKNWTTSSVTIGLMAIISPTITAENPHIYREQIELVQPFAKRLHIDLMDGVFTPNKSIDIAKLWWPENMIIDLHVMYKDPSSYLDEFLRLKPELVIVQAESDCDIPKFAAALNEALIKCGVALLPTTQVDSITYVFAEIQHVLIFSGNLGHQGGSNADLTLLDKVKHIKTLNPSLEVAWDGGVNDQNAKLLSDAGVDVLDVGGFIHTSQNPLAAYNTLTTAVN
jgi:ribulose-phosphate 3-epimerase